LEERNPIEVKNGKMVNTATLDSIEGGLFDAKMVATNKWGKVTLDTPLPNPAFEKQICQLLNIKLADMRKVLAGEITLKEA
jgi:DNA-directed RNA polymerase beta' subunit